MANFEVKNVATSNFPVLSPGPQRESRAWAGGPLINVHGLRWGRHNCGGGVEGGSKPLTAPGPAASQRTGPWAGPGRGFLPQTQPPWASVSLTGGHRRSHQTLKASLCTHSTVTPTLFQRAGDHPDHALLVLGGTGSGFPPRELDGRVLTW